MVEWDPVGGVKDSRTGKEAKLICKLLAVNPTTSAAGEGSFSSVRTASEDVASIQDGWQKV